MGGIHLEIFKFGLYIMWPIGIMYYFGTNLDGRFDVPGLRPKAENGHRIPFEKEELQAEVARLRTRRLAIKRLERQQEKERLERQKVAEAAGAPAPPQPKEENSSGSSWS